MSLTWKDAVATLLSGGAGIILYGKLKGYNWPLLSSWRLATLALLVIGLGACIIIGSGAVPAKNGWTTTASILGGLAFFLILTGLITGNKLFFFAVGLDIIALWAITTMHHVFIHGG
jgi:hypothetical protein